MARTTPIHSGYAIINGAGTGPNGDRIDVWVEYKTTQDINNNRSLVTAYFYAALHPGESSDTYGSSGCNSFFSVNGVSGTGLKKNGNYDFRSTSTINSLGTFAGYVPHNSDGTKTIAITGSFTTKSSWITGGSISRSVTLPTIPRGLMRVNVAGVWRDAQVYANVNGVWRPTQAYANVNGVWRYGV